MNARGIRTSRTSAGVAGLVAVLLLVPLQAGVAAEEEPADGQSGGDDVPLETSLAGYDIGAEGSPLAVLLFEPVTPVPVDPGEPHFEIQTSYTRTSLQTGPKGRGLASSAWPGALFGDGFATLSDAFFGEEQDYPVMADARYPAGPEEADTQLPTGTGMRASARGLDVRAAARAGETPEELLTTGSYSSRSRSTVEEDVAIATVHSSAKDVVLLEGLVEVDAVVTRLRATHDGEQGTTDGATNVTGLRLAGTGFAIDETGLRPVEEDEPGDPLGAPASAATPQELRDELGISVALLEHEEEVEGAAASRAAGGLHITIDTTVLRGALEDPVLSPLIENLPRQFVESPAYPLLFLAPKVEFFIARGDVSTETASSAGFEFDLGDFAADAPPPPPAGGEMDAPAPQTGSSPSLGGGSAPSVGEGSRPEGVAEPDVADPDVAAPETSGAEPQAAMEPVSVPGTPGGNALVVLFALAGAAVASRGLLGLPGLAFGGAGGPTCPAGHPTGVPDLREV